MIEVKPELYNHFSFPTCDSDDVEVRDIIFMGIHTLAKCYCRATQQEFYHTFPIGHTRVFPIAFSEDGNQTYYLPASEHWLARPLINAFFQKAPLLVSVQKKVYRKYDCVIILNCLDNCYGHMLYKLFNAEKHLSKSSDIGLILLIPQSLLWLVPEGVAEVWWIEIPLRALSQRLEGLDDFVKQEITRFRKVYLSVASMHLDTSRIDIVPFTKLSPFPLDRFTVSPLVFTFICREDRFWLTTQVEYYLYLASIKFKVLDKVRGYFVYRQNRLIRKTVRHIKQQYKEATFTATGIGKTGVLGKDIQDDRVAGEVSVETEKRWCQYYATSHVVIGVHGSGMLIPSAMAAAFINLLPRHKIPHIGEDIIITNSNYAPLFLGRFLNLPASSRLVEKHVLGLIKSFPYRYRETDKI